jgi:hypothetical protein
MRNSFAFLLRIVTFHKAGQHFIDLPAVYKIMKINIVDQKYKRLILMGYQNVW